MGPDVEKYGEFEYKQRLAERAKEDLLPCPFCGGHNITHAIYSSEGFMECGGCGAMGPGVTPDYDIDSSKIAWNTRAR
jgi:Lar family restriction alleviation protein